MKGFLLTAAGVGWRVGRRWAHFWKSPLFERVRDSTFWHIICVNSYVCVYSHTATHHIVFLSNVLTNAMWCVAVCEYTHTYNFNCVVSWLSEQMCVCSRTQCDVSATLLRKSTQNGVATISRLLKMRGLFCKRALWKRLYSAEDAYDFKEPNKIIGVFCRI